MTIDALIASEVFYLLSISQSLPSLRARFQGKFKPVAYAPAIGILSVIILQFLFSQWSIMNQLFNTAPLTLVQVLICVATGLPVVVLAFIYFSMGTFFRIGYGDQVPTGWNYLLVGLEALSSFLLEMIFLAQVVTAATERYFLQQLREHLEDSPSAGFCRYW